MAEGFTSMLASSVAIAVQFLCYSVFAGGDVIVRIVFIVLFL